MRAGYFFIFFSIVSAYQAYSQDIGLMNLEGQLPATYVNPATIMDKKWNIAFAGLSVGLNSDGPVINDLTSQNTLGKRYLDVNKISQNLNDINHLFLDYEIHTLDVGLQLGNVAFMAGHSFKAQAAFQYPKKLIEVLAQGNAPFINQPIQIGPSLDLTSYNQFYLGAQKTLGRFTIGIKGKLIYGLSNIYAENSDIVMRTDDEFYQIEFKNNYLVRTSNALRYNRLDSIDFDYSALSFDHIFFNNSGFGFDLGLTFKLNEKLTLSASALDIGSISWDFSPKAYSSTGTFTFDGIDLASFLGDTSFVGIKDTLLDVFKVKTENESYSTTLNNTFTLGASYEPNQKWTFNVLYRLKNDFSIRRHFLSLAAVRKFSVLNLGLTYNISKNNFTSFGLFSNVRLGPFNIYAATDNILGLNLLNAGQTTFRFGTTLQF